MKKQWENYSNTRFQALQSLNKHEFDILLKQFQPIVDKYFRLGAFFNISQGKVSIWVKQILPLLQEAFGKADLLPTQQVEVLYRSLEEESEEVILIQDATTREIERTKDYQVQKQFYDGKQKQHTIKNHLIINEWQHILYVGPLYEGSVHDKKLIEEENLSFPDQVIMLQDLGFQGYEPNNIVTTILI